MSADNCGIDGCSIPTYAVPLKSLAHGFARMATGTGLAPERAAAARRLIDACMAEPFYVAGTDSADTTLMQAAPGRIFVKTGAEGVFCAARAGTRPRHRAEDATTAPPAPPKRWSRRCWRGCLNGDAALSADRSAMAQPPCRTATASSLARCGRRRCSRLNGRTRLRRAPQLTRLRSTVRCAKRCGAERPGRR